MENVVRVGVSFEPDLLNIYDKLIKEKGYSNRSEAIRDLVRKEISEAEISKGKGEIIGTLTYIYDHDHSDLLNKLLHIQHHHQGHSTIMASTHIHMDQQYCLEVMVIKGDIKEVRELADGIRALKGVLFGELVVTNLVK
jgi:CopG family nickel-responsive transcriptional regulator